MKRSGGRPISAVTENTVGSRPRARDIPQAATSAPTLTSELVEAVIAAVKGKGKDKRGRWAQLTRELHIPLDISARELLSLQQALPFAHPKRQQKQPMCNQMTKRMQIGPSVLHKLPIKARHTSEHKKRAVRKMLTTKLKVPVAPPKAPWRGGTKASARTFGS